MAQPKGLKVAEYWMYFPLLTPYGWGKRFGIQPQSICSEVPKKKEVNAMSCHANKCVECTVTQCANHCDSANYCSLERILVGTHEANPTMDQCTDCKSFRKK